MSRESLELLAWYYIACCHKLSEAGLKGYARLDGERAHCLRLIESCLASRLWTEVSYLVVIINTYLNLQGYYTEQVTAINMYLIAAEQVKSRDAESWGSERVRAYILEVWRLYEIIGLL